MKAPGVVTHQGTKTGGGRADRISFRIYSGWLFSLRPRGRGVHLLHTFSFRVAGRTSHRALARAAGEMGVVMRSYTSKEIAPLVQQLGIDKFHPQIVRVLRRSTALAELRRRFPDCPTARPRSIPPTSKTVRPIGRWAASCCCLSAWNPESKELSGDAGTGAERHFYIARPIRMASPDCLQCHSTPDVAPASMVAQYGQNGFGWKMDDVVGMQLVEVPVAGPNAQAWIRPFGSRSAR